MLSVAFVSAALLQATAPSMDTTATRAALLSADRDLSRIAATNPAAFLDRLEPDAPLLLPTQPVLRGREQARKAYLERYAANDLHFEWTPLHAVASSDGRFGCTTGTTSTRTRADSVPRHGRYLTCWDRQGDGGWGIAVHARNGETPAVPLPGTTLEGAAHSAISSSSDLDAALVADAAFARLALDSGPAAAFAAFAANDAMLLGGRASPPRGPQDIRAVFSGFGTDQRLLWNPVRGAGIARGGLAFTIGLSAISTAGSGEEAQGHYLTVWRREPDGSWRFIFDLGSGRPADSPLDGHLALAVRLQARLDSLRASGEFRGATFTAFLPGGLALTFTTGVASPIEGAKVSPPQGSVHTSLGDATKYRITQPGYETEILDFPARKLKAGLKISSGTPTPPETLEAATIELAQIVAATL